MQIVCVIAACGLASGCASRPAPPPTGNVTFFLPGVAGDGKYYDELLDECARTGRAVQVIPWGMPKLFFVVNFSDKTVHDRAERELAAVLLKRSAADPAATVELIGHSAGCGVVLGALARLPEGFRVGRVILIAPSVSPGYDLAPGLARADRIDVYSSARDTTFLGWRCRTFGTYDRVRTEAAGFGGFATRDDRLHEYAWTIEDTALGNDGSHFGGLSRVFVRRVILAE